MHEAKKLKKTKKVKAVAKPPSISNILKRMERKNLEPGDYEVKGHIVRIGENGEASLVEGSPKWEHLLT